MTRFQRICMLGCLASAVQLSWGPIPAQANQTSSSSQSESRKTDEPRTSVGCGNVNPHMVATAYSDDPGRPPKTFKNENTIKAGDTRCFRSVPMYVIMYW